MSGTFGTFTIGSFVFALVYLLLLLVPLALAVWFIRTLSAMAAAQREIAHRLGDIEAYLRTSTSRPVT